MTILSIEALMKKYIPMTESAFYTLLSLKEPRHGYGIMQHIEKLTDGRLKLGAGTLYGLLSRMEKENLIMIIAEENTRKIYKLTEIGNELLLNEFERLKLQIKNAESELKEDC